MSHECYPVLWTGQVAVVSLPVEVDITNADTVREQLLSVLNQGASPLIADMSKTTFCDSAGMRALVRSFRRATDSGSGMHLVVNAPAIQRVLSIAGVDRLITTYPSVAASLAGAAVPRQEDNVPAKPDPGGAA